MPRFHVQDAARLLGEINYGKVFTVDSCESRTKRSGIKITLKIRYLRLVRRTFRALRHRRLRNLAWWRTLTRPLFNRNLWVPCRDTVASGIAIGLFFSMMPIPFQTIPSALIAMKAKANVPFAVAACWITNPLTIPFVFSAQFKLGQWMHDSLNVPKPPFLGPKAADFTLGFLTSGVLLALCAYPLVHLFSALLPQHLPVRKSRLNAEDRRQRRRQSDAS
ncbi:DUF2062 domain-containing protein [Luteolibacter pohnpeiensis]|uniref:DUF2062 domain-containing protein n=1 Tax=Luteolibacter pohnpeiensis TaxID=454153 RepID=A0A934S856_9BACT|nr:DUF2062 domain-containing protein [Luteolibacter pohnpeiensis]MBK1883080.1 DUF2062 domain-containing protein [Luteolibacter pohnpeiensis]